MLGAVVTIVPVAEAFQVMEVVFELPMNEPEFTDPAKPGTFWPLMAKPISRVVLGIGFGGP